MYSDPATRLIESVMKDLTDMVTRLEQATKKFNETMSGLDSRCGSLVQEFQAILEESERESCAESLQNSLNSKVSQVRMIKSELKRECAKFSMIYCRIIQVQAITNASNLRIEHVQTQWRHVTLFAIASRFLRYEQLQMTQNIALNMYKQVLAFVIAHRVTEQSWAKADISCSVQMICREPRLERDFRAIRILLTS
jgi:predicted RNase H-like nuclease (RuvC/YqgF family)